MSYLKKAFVLILSVFAVNTAALAIQTGSFENSNNEEETGSVNAFLQSDFVQTSVWPGLGPFHKSANDNHLVDPAGNQLTYSTVGKRINSCQLEVHGGSNEAQCMLTLQMSADFLLESLGVKPGQIHIVNTEVSKSSKLLTGNNFNPVQAVIAPLVVSLQNMGVNEGTDNLLYRIAVIRKDTVSVDEKNSKEQDESLTSVNGQSPKGQEENLANLDNTKTNKKQEDKIAKEEPIEIAAISPDEENHQTSVASTAASMPPIPVKKWFQAEKTNKTADTADNDNKVEVVRGSQIIKQSAEASTKAVDEPSNNIAVDADSTNAEKETVKTETTTKPLSSAEQQKKDFQDIIQNWQSLKKTAVKERQVNLLSQALAGKALIRQSDAIKWLISNHKYYEMSPGGAKIEKVNALVPGKKFAVYAEVKEKTKYIDDSNGKVIKDSDDTYKVDYTIEKVGEHWLITDSALIKSAAEKPSSGKPIKAVTKTSH